MAEQCPRQEESESTSVRKRWKEASVGRVVPQAGEVQKTLLGEHEVPVQRTRLSRSWAVQVGEKEVTVVNPRQVQAQHRRLRAAW